MATVLETTGIPPPPGAPTRLTLPLTYFDIPWIHFHPIRRLLFYEHPCSADEFLALIVPKLKQSLSLTLKHYLPIAGNLLYPLPTAQKPLIRYVSGDSVPLTIAVATNDFDHLTGYSPRNADQFYDFVPQMPPVIDDSEYRIVPIFALQATLFPGRGICIGFVNHHVLGDASSIAGFIRAWASISKLGGDDEFGIESLPIFDRRVVDDSGGFDSMSWEVMREIPFTAPPPFPLPTNRVRATYILKNADIIKLKGLVSARNPGMTHVSSFVAATSYVWSCLVKSGEAVGEESVNDGMEYFTFMVDVRARVNLPIPANYFGNCLSYATAKVERGRLAGEEGLAEAAEAVGGEIRERVNKGEEVLKGMWNWRSSLNVFLGLVRPLGVSGSPKFDLCAADFGWGKATKLEVLSIDGEKYSFSLCKARQGEGEGEGGLLEVGLSLEKDRMEAFAAIFAAGLTSSESELESE